MNTVVDKPEYTLGRQEAARLREMESAFLGRPRLSIRLRIVAGFLLCFFLLAITGLINLAILYEARGKLHFLDISQELSLEVQQARHLQRQSFPNLQNLREARESAKKASALLVAQGVNILDISGENELVALNYKIGHYVQLLDDALTLLEQNPPQPGMQSALADKLESRSGEIMDLLRTMKAREAASVNSVLRISQELPFVFAGVMLLIIFWITNLLVNTITDSLKRLENSTRRIATGDFSLQPPARRYRDELSDLSLAVNRMLLELRARKVQVARADKLASVGAFTAGIAQNLRGVFGEISSSSSTLLEHCGPRPDCPLLSLLEGISADFPMSSSSLLERCESRPDCPRRTLLEGISAETQRGSATVEGLLAFTADEALDLGPVGLATTVESAWDFAQHHTRAGSVEFRNEIPDPMPPVIAASGQLKQVFFNLFDNAVQAMPEGGALTVRAGFLGEGQVEVTVADQGVGIAPEILPHVCDPSFTTREGGAGTGLGLSLAHSLVESFGGNLRVESVVGKGTTVHITLRLAG